MEDPRHAQGPANNVLGIGQRILTTLVGIAETRVRLAVVELEEEKANLFQMLLMLGLTMLFAAFGLMSLEQLKRTVAGEFQTFVRDGRVFRQIGNDVNAGAFAYLNVAFHFQHDDRFTHHGAADAFFIRDKALGGQFITDKIDTLLDAIFQLRSKLLIQTTWFGDFHMRSRQGTADDLLYHFCMPLSRFCH